MAALYEQTEIGGCVSLQKAQITRRRVLEHLQGQQKEENHWPQQICGCFLRLVLF